MRNLNKSNVLTSIESINRTLKNKVEKIILKIWINCVPSSVKVGTFLLRNPRVKSELARTVQRRSWTYAASCNENAVQRVTDLWFIACKLWLQQLYIYFCFSVSTRHNVQEDSSLHAVSFQFFFFHGTMAPSRPKPPHYRGFTIALRHTTLGRTPLGEWLPIAKNSTLKNRTLTRYRHPSPRRDWNPRSHIHSYYTNAVHSSYWRRPKHKALKNGHDNDWFITDVPVCWTLSTVWYWTHATFLVASLHWYPFITSSGQTGLNSDVLLEKRVVQNVGAGSH